MNPEGSCFIYLSANIQFYSGLVKETILALDNAQVWQVNSNYPYEKASYYLYAQVPATIYEFEDKIYMAIQGMPNPVGVHRLEFSSIIESRILLFEGMTNETIIELENGQVWQVDSNFQHALHTTQAYELLPMVIYEVNGKYLMTLLGSHLTAVVHQIP